MIEVDLDYFCDKLRELETPEQRREFVDVFGKYPVVNAAPEREDVFPTGGTETS